MRTGIFPIRISRRKTLLRAMIEISSQDITWEQLEKIISRNIRNLSLMWEVASLVKAHSFTSLISVRTLWRQIIEQMVKLNPSCQPLLQIWTLKWENRLTARAKKKNWKTSMLFSNLIEKKLSPKELNPKISIFQKKWLNTLAKSAILFGKMRLKIYQNMDIWRNKLISMRRWELFLSIGLSKFIISSNSIQILFSSLLMLLTDISQSRLSRDRFYN